MGKYKVQYRGDHSSDGPSPIIWGDCPWLGAIEDPGIGFGFFDDFIGSCELSLAPYLIDESDDKASIAGLGIAGGACRLGITGDDNEECWILGGGGVSFPFVISDTAGSDKKLWFECRYRVSAVTDDVCGIVFGLADSNVAAGDNKVQADDTAALADIGFIGFQSLQADGNSLDAFYRKNGQTGVQIIDGADVIVADTWAKAGFVYDPDADTANRITYYIDEVKQTTYVTGTQIATATFPDGVFLNFVAAAKVGSDAALNFDIDWWRCFQMR